MTNPEHDQPTGATPRSFQPILRALQGLEAGRVEFRLPDGRNYRCDGQKDGPHGVVEVRNPALFGRLIRRGELGFFEAYVDGWWDTPDLQSLLDVLLLNNDHLRNQFKESWIAGKIESVQHWLRANTRRQARKNIAQHYDLGNEFYGRWLDETMTYSSAHFDTGAETLAEAQTRKYSLICDRIGVQPDNAILEIGCGWGGFAEYAAAERGARVTALTISREQHDFAAKRIFDAGLNDRVTVALRDYRDETGRYDGIASIEMFEAVGEKYWPVYFDTVRERLNPGGKATLQIITVADKLFDSYRKRVDFIQKYIFPGGVLPSHSALQKQIERAGLIALESANFGQSYSETLRRWFDKFNTEWDEIARIGFDEKFRRIWNFYLASCAACFRYETTDVAHITIARPA
jgi:cyclopropane-fatty-acyl-phospholipid synthase